MGSEALRNYSQQLKSSWWLNYGWNRCGARQLNEGILDRGASKGYPYDVGYRLGVAEYRVSIDVNKSQAHPLDSADTQRLKAESYFKDSLTRDLYTWLDIAQSLAQRVSSGDIVTRDDFSLGERVGGPFVSGHRRCHGAWEGRAAITPKTFACLEAHAAQLASRANPNHYSHETRGRIKVPINEVGEGSSPANGVYGGQHGAKGRASSDLILCSSTTRHLKLLWHALAERSSQEGICLHRRTNKKKCREVKLYRMLVREVGELLRSIDSLSIFNPNENRNELLPAWLVVERWKKRLRMDLGVFVRAVRGESHTYDNKGVRVYTCSVVVGPTHPIYSMIYGSTGATHFDQLAKILTGYEITGARSSGIFMVILSIAVRFLFKITTVLCRAAVGRTAAYRWYRQGGSYGKVGYFIVANVKINSDDLFWDFLNDCKYAISSSVHIKHVKDRIHAMVGFFNLSKFFDLELTIDEFCYVFKIGHKVDMGQLRSNTS
ncbi:hypothetical protein ACFX2J_003169 [Malus domestica]